MARLMLITIVAMAMAGIGARGATAGVPAGLARAPPEPLPTERPAPLLLDEIKLPPGFSISLYINESDVSKQVGP